MADSEITEILGLGKQSTLYEVIGVDRNATDKDIATAVRNRCKTFHPDKLKDIPEELRQHASESYSKVQHASFVLRDRRRRAIYDACGHEGDAQLLKLIEFVPDDLVQEKMRDLRRQMEETHLHTDLGSKSRVVVHVNMTEKWKETHSKVERRVAQLFPYLGNSQCSSSANPPARPGVDTRETLPPLNQQQPPIALEPGQAGTANSSHPIPVAWSIQTSLKSPLSATAYLVHKFARGGPADFMGTSFHTLKENAKSFALKIRFSTHRCWLAAHKYWRPWRALELRHGTEYDIRAGLFPYLTSRVKYALGAHTSLGLLFRLRFPNGVAAALRNVGKDYTTIGHELQQVSVEGCASVAKSRDGPHSEAQLFVTGASHGGPVSVIAKWQRARAEARLAIECKVDLGTRATINHIVFYRRLNPTTEVGIGAVIGSSSMLLLVLARHQHEISVPVSLPAVTTLAGHTATLGTWLAAWFLVDFVLLLPVIQIKKMRHRRALKAERLPEFRKAVEREMKTQALTAHRSEASLEREAKVTNGGLVIMSAKYGCQIDGVFDDDLSLDVRVALQGLVHNSRLSLPRESKALLEGFCDTNITGQDEKVLEVYYSFLGGRHKVSINDSEELRLPDKRHLIQDLP